ncbi:hypothetical protein ED312_13920 [Sinomicrobium pectinilyticum]|uniref:Uncharacterized protein n=1 Tax=Sinomicrobium pectinilyticum TaxID=1084421 RepID=A0A3N0E8X3_SINP1|nr:hypothetical protein ED312_13920 [Sinomicrobium pectinilyticum]
MQKVKLSFFLKKKLLIFSIFVVLLVLKETKFPNISAFVTMKEKQRHKYKSKGQHGKANNTVAGMRIFFPYKGIAGAQCSQNDEKQYPDEVLHIDIKVTFLYGFMQIYAFKKRGRLYEKLKRL